VGLDMDFCGLRSFLEGFLWRAAVAARTPPRSTPLRHHKKMNKFKYSSLHLFLRKYSVTIAENLHSTAFPS
jgi:hypothetical protein